jgi:anaerobic magnesium-protoporphyrin IX monomethyl ester cyclase
MKVAVVNPPWQVDNRTGIRSGCRFPNLTIRNTNRYVPFPFLVAYTASFLEGHGMEVLAIDGCAERCGREEFLRRVEKFVPNLIIAETSTTSLAYDLAILQDLHTRCPGARIAVYGSHTDARPEDALASLAVDFVIQGEPELTALELAEVLDGGRSIEGILGLAHRNALGATCVHPRRPVITDIDDLPYPKRDSLPMNSYYVPGFPPPVRYLYGGRGCPFQCNFCLWPQTTLAGKFRPRAGEKIVEEMAWLLQRYPDTRSFFFDDDTFNLGRQRMLDFAAAMKRRGMRIPWGCNARADHWDREVLQELRDTGLFTLRIGIESGDQRVLDLSGKHLNLEEARRTLEMSAAMGIQNHIMFVIGLAGENRESVENTIRFIKSVPCHSVQFSVAVPFPGTSLYRDAEAKGHLVTKDWSKYSGFDHVVVRTDELTAEGVGQALARARRSVYFSPRFIKNRLGYIRNPRDLSALARKALRLMTRSAFDRVG